MLWSVEGLLFTVVSGQPIGPIFKVQGPSKMGPISFPEKSVTKYLLTLLNVPEKRRSLLYSGENLKSRTANKLAKPQKVTE
jgi:hypothetical protein